MASPSRIRKLASETAVYGVSSVVGRLINFLLFPFYSQFFPPDVYGPIFVVYTAFVFLNILYQHGMESAYLKFAAESHEKRSHVFGSAILSIAIVGLVLTALLLLFPSATASLITLDASYLHLLYWAAAILVLDALAVIPLADLRLSNRPWRFALVRTANIVVNVALNLYLIIGLELGIEAILIANAIASAVTLILLAPQFTQGMGAPEPALLQRMWRFGYPFILGGLGYAVTERLNIFFLGELSDMRVMELYADRLTDPELAANVAQGLATIDYEYIQGAYGGIFKLAIFMALIVQMFRYAWQPFFLQHQRDEDAPRLFGRVFVLLSLVMTFVYLAVAFLADDLVRLPLPGGRTLISRGYWLALDIIPVALVGYIFQGWYYHFSTGTYIREKTRYLLPSTLVGSAVALILNALLVPRYGMMAAAGATTASYMAMSFVLYVLIQKHYPIEHHWGRVLLILLMAACLFSAWALFEGMHVWWIEIGLLMVFLAGAVPVTWKTLSRLPTGRERLSDGARNGDHPG